MEEVNFGKLSKSQKFLVVVSFVFFLIIFSVIWGLMSAEETTTPAIPLAPSNLILSGTPTATSVSLSWTDNANNEDKFNIERKLSSAVVWPERIVQITVLNTTTYTDTSVTGGNTYDYRVQACLSGTGCSEYAALSGISVLAATGGGGSSCTTLNLTLNDGKNTYTVGDSVNYTWACVPSGTTAGNVSIYLQKPDGSSTNYNSGSGSSTLTMGFGTSNLLPGAHILKACFDTACATANASQTFTVVSVSTTPTITTPSAPTSLTLNGSTTSTSVPLRWTDNSSNEDSFKIERKLTSATTFTTITSISSNVTTYIDTSITSGFYYDYRVQACYSTACSDYANLTGVSVPVSGIGYNIPNAPTGLSLNGTVVSRSVPLRWTDNSSNEDSFKIERKLSTAMTYSYIGQVGASITSYTDTMATAGVTYDYHVQACLNSVGCSTYSTLAGVAVTTVPSSPNTSGGGGDTSGSGACLGLTLTLSGGKTSYVTGESVNYTWTCYPGGTASNVSIWVQKPDGTSTNYNSGTNSGTQSMGFSTSNLVPGNYILKACFSPTCATVTASQTFSVGLTAVIPPATVIPLPPTNLTLDSIVIPGAISIQWKDAANNEDKFNIERKLSSATTWSYLAQVGTNIIHYFDSTAVAGKNYDYRVQACLSGTGCSSYISLSDVSVTTTAGTPPFVPPTTPIPPITTKDVPKTPPIVPSTPDTIINPTVTTTPNETFLPNPPIVSTTTNEFSVKIQDLGTVVGERRVAVDNSRDQLIKIIDKSVEEIVKNNPGSEQKINSLRDELLKSVDSGFSMPTTLTSTDINNLKTAISKKIDEIKLLVNESSGTFLAGDNSMQQINVALNTLTNTVNDQSQTLKDQGGDLLYKDTNKDGISDYDSVHVYNLDPIKPSFTSTYEGKKINASEKILLGLDPTKKEIVKVEKEQPVESTLAPVSTYKVKEVAMTEKKEVVIRGEALPNSFVTIYVYSTPIMVTIKTDSNGEWQYVLDKELDNGDHAVYTATVNNSGNIIAKSTGFIFTKTAEAATLKDLPLGGVSVDIKPGLMTGNSLYLLVVGIFFAIVIILILLGVSSKKGKEEVS